MENDLNDVSSKYNSVFMKISLNYVFIAIILLAVSQYFIVSMSSPIVFGDEGFYASTSSWISENHIIPEFFPFGQNDVEKQRAAIIPLFFMIETFFFYFGEIGVKIMFPLLATITALAAYTIISKISNKKIGFLSAITLAMTPSFITYGVMGYTDVLLVLVSLMAINFTVNSFDSDKKINTIMAGIFSGLAILTKQSGLFIVFFLIFYALTNKNKNKIKILTTILLIILIVVSPLLIRNISKYSDICYRRFAINPENCGSFFTEDPNNIEGLEFEGRNTGSGTEAGLLSFGILNYFLFSNGLTITLLLLFGLGLLALKYSNKLLKLSIITIASTLPILYFSLERAEDTARYLLPMNIGIIMIVGYFINEVYEKSKSYNKYLAYTIIAILLFSLWVYGQEKIDTMYLVKGFSPGFLNGCEWIRENTPEDSLLFSTYEYHTRYQCDRKAMVVEHKEEILLSFNDTSYQTMKKVGLDYIFVMKGLISDRKFSENYPVEFINYIENSNKFKKVYDNSDVYGQNGIIVYEVL